jgi:hypothetical protein
MHHIDPKQFINRIPAGSPPRYRENIETVFKLAENFRGKVAAIEADPSLTGVGKADAVKKLWVGAASQHFAQIKTGVAKELADIRQQRASLYPKAPDRSDLFGELQRAEARAWLRGLDDGARHRVALETNDQTIRDAILFAAPELSGLTPEIKSHVVERVVEGQFGPQLRELDAQEEAAANVDAAIQITEQNLAKLPGLSDIRRAA